MTTQSTAQGIVGAPRVFIVLDASGRVFDKMRQHLCGGLTLEERMLRQLRRAGCNHVTVITEQDLNVHQARQHAGPWARRMRYARPDLLPERMDRVTGTTCLNDAVVPGTILTWLPANALIHPQLLARLMQTEDPVHVVQNGFFAGAAKWSAQSGAQPAGRALAPREIEIYDAGTRKIKSAYFHPILDQNDLCFGSEFLLSRTQKDALDLPARYLHPRFENFLVRIFAPTHITPNIVTIATTAAAFVVTALYTRGYLKTGVLVAAAVGVLDGVDGKLARLRLETSRLGEIEHFLDFLYENSWYLALASHFSRRPRAGTRQRAVPWLPGAGPLMRNFGVALIASDIVDNLAYFFVKTRTGRMIDELSPGDRAFRAIAGRRNIYNWILLPCFLLGSIFHEAPVSAFRFAARWAVLTATIHSLRALSLLSGQAGFGTARRN